MTTTSTATRPTTAIVFGAVALVMLVLALMQVTGSMNWGPLDFALAAMLLGGAALAFELATRKLRHPYWLGAALVIAAIVLTVWVEVAVGAFGTPIAGD